MNQAMIHAIVVSVVSTRGAIELRIAPGTSIATVRRAGEDLGLLHEAGYEPRPFARAQPLDRIELGRLERIYEEFQVSLRRLG